MFKVLFSVKKIYLVSLSILVFLTVLFGCSFKYAVWQWQSISIPEVGTFRVPGDWIVTQSNNVVYITDKPIDEEGYKIYLIGKTEDGRNRVPYSEYFENIEYIKSVRGVIYSNSALFSIHKINVNGNIVEKYIITLSNTTKDIDLLAWDNLIDENTMKKIAQSYDPY
jgi:hypothetical protein